jgi:hypothetical protein
VPVAIRTRTPMSRIAASPWQQAWRSFDTLPHGPLAPQRRCAGGARPKLPPVSNHTQPAVGTRLGCSNVSNCRVLISSSSETRVLCVCTCVTLCLFTFSGGTINDHDGTAVGNGTRPPVLAALSSLAYGGTLCTTVGTHAPAVSRRP